MLRRLRCLLAAACLALAMPLQANAQGASAYRYAAPPGWARSVEGDIEVLTPRAEPADTAQLMMLAPKPATGDFRAQFESERATLEQFWGLRDPHAAPLQGGQTAVSSYAAYFASYDSDGGPRYMGFMALGDGRRFGLLVFVAATHDAFNRLAPLAVEVFKGLALQP
jgi:hypothetical protein